MKARVDFDHFAKIDLRVGTVLAAEISPKARVPAYKLTIDFGALGTRTSSAQITERYPAQHLVGKQVIAVVNFEPRQVATVLSEVLVLAVVGQHGGVVLLTPDAPLANGGLVR